MILYFQTREIRDSESISSVIWFWDFCETEYHFESFLDLRFFGKTIARDTLLDLKRSEFNERDPTDCKIVYEDSSGLCHIDTIGDISKKK
jgi:hypothetical protein